MIIILAKMKKIISSLFQIDLVCWLVKWNLKTTNAFSLGGLNFKGFDYRGLGPIDTDTYLGGNNFYTLTLGYGGQFLFDKKDNINFRTFITSGSIWDSDYAANNDFKNRLSAGLSLDIMTAVFQYLFHMLFQYKKKMKI